MPPPPPSHPHFMRPGPGPPPGFESSPKRPSDEAFHARGFANAGLGPAHGSGESVRAGLGPGPRQSQSLGPSQPPHPPSQSSGFSRQGMQNGFAALPPPPLQQMPPPPLLPPPPPPPPRKFAGAPAHHSHNRGNDFSRGASFESQPDFRRPVKPVEASTDSPRPRTSSAVGSTSDVSQPPPRGDLAHATDGKVTTPSTVLQNTLEQSSPKKPPVVAISTHPATSSPSATHSGTPLRSAGQQSETPVANAPSPKPRVPISIPLSRPASDLVQSPRAESPTLGRSSPQPSPRLLSDTRSASVNCFSSVPSMDTAAVLLQLSKVEESLNKVGREMRVRELQLEDEANGAPRGDDEAETNELIASDGGSDARSIALDVAARFANKNRDCVEPVRQVRHPHCEVLVDIIAQNRTRAAAANAALRRICMDSERGLDASRQNATAPSYVMPPEVGDAVRAAIASNVRDTLARRRAMSKEYSERLTIWKKRTRQAVDKRSREKRDACKERDRFLFRAIHGEGAVLSLRTSSGRTSTKVLTGVTSGGTPFVNPSAEVDAAVAELEIGGTPGSELIWSRTLADLPVQNASAPPTDCGSVLIEDPVAMYINACAVNPWSREETLIFLEKFVVFQKDFRRIATFLEHKSTADVIRFYYQNKLRLNLKIISLKRRGLKRVHLMTLAGLRRQSDSGKRSPKLTGTGGQPSVTVSQSLSPKRKHSATNGPPSKRPRMPRQEDIVLSANASSSSVEVGRSVAPDDDANDANDAAEPTQQNELRDTSKKLSEDWSPSGVKPEQLAVGTNSGEAAPRGNVEGTANNEIDTEPEVVELASEEKVETKKKNSESTETEQKGSSSNVATSSVHDSETNGHVAPVAHPEARPSTTAGKVSPNLAESKGSKDASKPRAVWTLDERALFHKHYAANGNSWRKVAAIMPSKTMSQVKGYWLKLNAAKESERHKAKPSSSSSGGHDGTSTPHVHSAPPVQSSSGSETPVSVSELPSKSLGPSQAAGDPSPSSGERTVSPQRASDSTKLPNGIEATAKKREEIKPVAPRSDNAPQEMSLVLPLPRDPVLSGPADPVSRSGTPSVPKFRSAPSPGGPSLSKSATTPNAISKGPAVVARPQGLARIPLSSPSPSLSLRSVPSVSPQASGTPRAPGSTRLQDIVKRARAAGFLANSGPSNPSVARSSPSVEQPAKLEETDAKK